MAKLKLTSDEVTDASENCIGYCRLCGAERLQCEPDAENYTCDECEAAAVDGIDIWLCNGNVEIIPDHELTAEKSNG